MRGNRLMKRLDTMLGRVAILALSVGPKGRRAPANPPRRVLVVKLAALGDTLLLVPALRELRARFPDAEIGFLGTELNRELIGLYPGYVDRFVSLDVGEAARSPGYLVRFVRGLAADGWELGVDFDQWTHITPLLLRAAGIPTRVGFRTHLPIRHRLYTRVVERRVDRHEAENFLALLEPLGVRPPAPVLELPVDPHLARRYEVALREHGWRAGSPIVLVHPGCGAHGGPRAWPVESYLELCVRLRQRTDAFLVFTGAGAERPIADRLASAFPGHSWVPETGGLRELIACLSHASVVVSGNTGVMHLASALGLPQVALHGPTDARKWGPINPRAVVISSSCPHCPCLDLGWEFHRTDGYCMAQIGVDEVDSAVTTCLIPSGWHEPARSAIGARS